MTDRTERAPSAFRLNLEQQRNRAKDLLRAAKAADAPALARLAAVHDPRRSPGEIKASLKLADAQLALGTDAWIALTSDNPQRLAALARSGTPALPIMAPALHRHLRELPSVEIGLSLTEHLLLQILSEGSSTLVRVLLVMTGGREPLPWIGDLGMLHVVDDMLKAAEPVMVRTPAAPGERRFRQQLAITDAGLAVLRAELDWHSLKPPPRWVGGVHVQPGLPGWRWDEAKREAALV
jgi:hypothetical protein